VAYFQEHGFRVLNCGWYEPLNVFNFSNVAVERKTLGYCGTSWWGISNFRRSAEHLAAFIIAAENAWTNRRPELAEWPYPPTDACRRLAGLSAPGEATRFTLLDLSRHTTQTLTDNRRRSGFMGWGQTTTCATCLRVGCGSAGCRGQLLF